MASFRHRLGQFLRGEDGFVVSTERLVLLSLITCALVVALAGVREALRNEFLDEVDAIAACSNQVVFPIPAQDGGLPGTFEIRCTEDFPPNLAEAATRPVPTPAHKEAELRFPGGDKEADPTP